MKSVLELFGKHTVYARYFRDFGLGWGIREGLIRDFCDVFNTINSYTVRVNKKETQI